ncbi:hypothetical protein EV363DRAFT_1496141 [Boletus edulis]|nr:hypothetical protein EV363DRAFT_1496141 [Boletus edulis]
MPTDLESAVHYFQCAMNCPANSQHRAAVLVNLAKAKFIRYQIDSTSADPDALILLYDEALNLRRPGHPDRPATLLLLAQTLLFCYEKQGHTQSVADKINELMSKFRDLPEDTHERRAADLEHSEPGNLDSFLETNEQFLQLLPSRHPDRLPCLKTLNAIEWRLFEIDEEISHLGKVIARGEEALELISEGHPERPYWVASSNRHLAETLEHSGDAAFEAQKYEEAIMRYSQAMALWSE